MYMQNVRVEKKWVEHEERWTQKKENEKKPWRWILFRQQIHWGGGYSPKSY